MTTAYAVIGVDMGATITSVCTYYLDSIQYRTSFNTQDGDTSPPVLMARIAEEIQAHLDLLSTKILCKGIGIVFPGPLNPHQGIVYKLPNVPGWEKPVAVREYFTNAFPYPVYFANDANALAIAEHTFGLGQDIDELIVWTISTGIGGGAYVNGLLQVGHNGGAAEFGHQKIVFRLGAKCGCGKSGCVEAYGSGTAIEIAGKNLLIPDEAAYDFNEYLKSRGLKRGDVTCIIVADAARAGVQSALRVLEIAAEAIGVALANSVNQYDPELVVLRGGVMNSADLLLVDIELAMRENIMNGNTAPLKLSPLGQDGGLLGAVALVLEETK